MRCRNTPLAASIRQNPSRQNDKLCTAQHRQAVTSPDVRSIRPVAIGQIGPERPVTQDVFHLPFDYGAAPLPPLDDRLQFVYTCRCSGGGRAGTVGYGTGKDAKKTMEETTIAVVGFGITILLALGGVLWRLDTRIEGVRSSLDRKIEGVRSSLDGKIEDVRSSLDGKIEGVRSSLDGKIEGARSDSDDAHKGITKNIDDVKDQLMKLTGEVSAANGKLSILEVFVKAYVEARSKPEN